MKINVEDAIQRIKAYRELNEPEDLLEIEFYQNGILVEIPQQVLSEFSYLGLNNTDFIRWYFMKQQFFTTITAEKDDGPRKT
jgi:hypothetical protein